jgi:Mg-chelatase subunit ChlD
MRARKLITLCHDRVSGRRGAMLVLIAALIIVFIGMVAFSVDVAYMQLSRTQLRIATDAAARAGGESLSRAQDLTVARQAAINTAAKNLVAGKPLVLETKDIVAGNVSVNGSGQWKFSANKTPINGFQVDGLRTKASPNGPVDLFFGRIFNITDYETSHRVVVVRLDRDICLVVDRSSSMKLSLTDANPTMSTSDPRFCQVPNSLSRWKALQNSVTVFNQTLDSTDAVEHVALVSFASSGTWCGVKNNVTDIDQALSKNTSDVQTAMSKISSRVFNGNTEIAAGIDRGTTVLTDTNKARPYTAKTMVVLTDGNQVGGRPPVDAAADAAAAGITVHAITFGDTSGASQMIAVADAGGGVYYHAADEAQLKAVFREIALTLPVILTE